MRFIAGQFLLTAIAVFPIGVSALVSDYNPGSVGAGAPEVHITRGSTISIRSARIAQVVGTTFYLAQFWGQLPMRFVMKTDKETQVIKKYGGQTLVSAMKVGDYVDADGAFIIGSDFFGVEAKLVRDWSLQEEQETFSGQVAALLPAAAFMLKTSAGKEIVVQPGTTTIILKGSVTIPAERLLTGDTVLFADGVYDYAKNTLAPRRVAVLQQKTIFSSRNYEGMLIALDGTTRPTQISVSVGGVPYRVRLGESTGIFKKNREPAELTRFVVGDTVRFFGPLLEGPFTLRDERVVEAEIVRNLNL